MSRFTEKLPTSEGSLGWEVGTNETDIKKNTGHFSWKNASPVYLKIEIDIFRYRNTKCIQDEGCCSSNIPHPESIACCSAPDLQQPATKASHTIGGNNTYSIELLMIGIEVEHRCKKPFSGI